MTASARLASLLVVMSLTALRGQGMALAESAPAAGLQAASVTQPGPRNSEQQPAPSPDGRRSGFAYMSTATPALQKDEGQNPAMLWVGDGLRVWREPAGRTQQRCADW